MSIPQKVPPAVAKRAAEIQKGVWVPPVKKGEAGKTEAEKRFGKK